MLLHAYYSIPDKSKLKDYFYNVYCTYRNNDLYISCTYRNNDLYTLDTNTILVSRVYMYVHVFWL